MNKDKAILIVSFGTTYYESIKESIYKLKDNIQNQFTNYYVYSAFTSEMIIKRLKKNNIHINTITEAIENMINKNIKHLIVQPIYVTEGIENNSMINEIKKYSNHFESIKIGDPLLTSINDYNRVANIIVKEFSNLNDDEALICMGHGSINYPNTNYQRLDNIFKDLGFNNIHVGTLKGEPSLNSIIPKLKQNKIKKVTLFPLMIFTGYHIVKDMAGDKEDSWKTVLLNNGFEVKCFIKGLCEIKEIGDIFIKHINFLK